MFDSILQIQYIPTDLKGILFRAMNRREKKLADFMNTVGNKEKKKNIQKRLDQFHI